MLTTLLYCLTFGWTASTGPVDHYKVFIVTEGIYEEKAVVATPPADLCFTDQQPHRVAVQAFDADGNQSPMSDESEEVQMIVEPPLFLHQTLPVVRSDLNGDRWVSVLDFGLFARDYGKCHDLLAEVPCPPN